MIYDRNGRPLTDNSSDYYSISANPYSVSDPERLAGDLSRLTGTSANTFINRMKCGGHCVVLARKITPEQAEKLESLGWNLLLDSETHRRYPHKTIAGQLIGFTDIDNRGISGIELTYDKLLKGKPGWRVVQLDVEGKQHLDKGYPNQSQVDGGDLVLTIDLSLQAILEQELKPALKQFKGRSATGLILDPINGEVLAAASLPSFDPNSPDRFSTSRQKNLTITEMYEPGSTFKLVPATLLLEDYHVEPDRVVDCGVGYITLYGRTIHDSRGFGELTFRNVLVKSSNVGMIKLTQNVKHRDLCRKIKEFGFLEKTGIELPGEAGGSLPELNEWSGLTLSNVVIGQGIAVNMLQLAMAYCTVANGGWLMKPTLVRELRYPDGVVERIGSEQVHRVMTSETAATLREILTDVVEHGTGRRAKIEDMSIAGKTGTAQLVNLEQGGYFKDRFFASFVGFFPVATPRYLILISVVDPQGPNGEHSGGNVCAPIFKRIAQRILGFRPELWTLNSAREDNLTLEQRVVPDLYSKTLSEVNKVLNSVGLKAVRHGSGVVYDQVPAPGMLAMKGDRVHVTLGPKVRSPSAMVVMPVLTGLSLRDAVKKATESGLMVKINGTGRVIAQKPNSGARITVGETCSLQAAG